MELLLQIKTTSKQKCTCKVSSYKFNKILGKKMRKNPFLVQAYKFAQNCSLSKEFIVEYVYVLGIRVLRNSLAYSISHVIYFVFCTK